jgi:TetR/AcrR family transcriptional repressor of nem operon
MDAAHELIWSYSYGAVTIEAICERARVKKGSFYYFFASKSDLAVAAINAWWDERRALVTEWFRPEVPGLQRLGKYIDFVVAGQLETYEETGQMLGCPLFTLGSEICTQDERILTLVREIMETGARLFEEAIRDAQASGEVVGNDATLKGRQLWAFYEGSLTRARIENNPELMRSMHADALELIGARPTLANVA